MSFKLNQLDLVPDYEVDKGFSISVAKEYEHTAVHGGAIISSVKSKIPQSVSVSFPLARSTASTGVILQNQVRELVGNVNVPSIYLQWSGATHWNGFYTLEGADIRIPEGLLADGVAEFSGKLTRLGKPEEMIRAGQCNKEARTTAYGTADMTPQSIHGFPIGDLWVTSGTTYNRVGSEGNIPIVESATDKDLFLYEPTETDIGEGEVRIYDDMGTDARAGWVEVFGNDHKFTGDVVMENSLVRVRSRAQGTSIPGGVSLLYYDGTSAYASAGTYSMVDTGGTNYGTQTPDVSLNKVSPEESEAVLAFPPSTSALRWSLKMQRGRWDVTCKPGFMVGATPGSMVVKAQFGTGLDIIESDASHSAGTAASSYTIAMATHNWVVCYDSATQFHQGMAKTGTTGHENTWTVVGSHVTEMTMSTGTTPCSIFAVVPPSGQDAPDDLGAQLLYDTENLPQVCYR